MNSQERHLWKAFNFLRHYGVSFPNEVSTKPLLEKSPVINPEEINFGALEKALVAFGEAHGNHNEENTQQIS